MKRSAIASVSILLLVMITAGFWVQRGKTRLRLEKSGNNIAQAATTRPSSEVVSQGSSSQGVNSLDSFRNEWYSKHLEAMNEPALPSMEGANEMYRFLWLRSFHHPIAIRVWRIGEDRNMVFKELDGAGGYEPGNLMTNRTRRLTADEWDKFITLLQKASYWQLPTEGDAGGKDGARWILEGKKEEQYRIVDRWSPRSGSYSEACLYLLKLSGQKRQEIY
jgi:hypothetical protein